MPDKDLAKLLGRGLPAGRAKRAELGRPPRNPVWKPWTEAEKALLGKLSDAEVARRTWHPILSVKHNRCKLRLPMLSPTRRALTAEEDELVRTLPLEEAAQRIGRIQIGTPQQFPEGWGRAAKGRTVWRIVEEAVVQNIKAHRADLGFAHAEAAAGETDLYDVKVQFRHSKVDLFLNLKTAARGRETKKGDISKADGIIRFFEKDAERQLFIVTLVVTFCSDMFIEIKKRLVVPITWLPDIYVNPQNNNLQCCQPKKLMEAIKRPNAKFIVALRHEMDAADAKRVKKAKKKRRKAVMK